MRRTFNGPGDRAQRHVRVDVLAGSELFQGVGEERLRAIADSSYFRPYARGQLIAGPEEWQRFIFLVLEGGVRRYRLSGGGDEVTLSMLHEGDVFGLLTRDRKVRIQTIAEAMREGAVVCHMVREDVLRVLEQEPVAAMTALDIVTHRLFDSDDHVEALAFDHVPRRVARALVRLAVKTGCNNIGVTHQELACMVSATQPEVTKILHRFRDAGWIAFAPHRRGITILDMDKLLEV